MKAQILEKMRTDSNSIYCRFWVRILFLLSDTTRSRQEQRVNNSWSMCGRRYWDEWGCFQRRILYCSGTQQSKAFWIWLVLTASSLALVEPMHYKKERACCELIGSSWSSDFVNNYHRERYLHRRYAWYCLESARRARKSYIPTI